ncbi:MAG: hypothetical protein BroJett038_00640 [Chloroflexota bacterium]|nr:MAG: hypothetical protein BroJett038_00640 [Chloroflexota bacterium]
MATQAVTSERSAAFTQLVRGWDRRLRLRQATAWLPRCLLPGLLAGITIAIVSRLRPWLLPGQVALATAAALVAGVLVMALVVRLWPRPYLAVARRFDRQFGLQERVSTALELLEGRLRADGELAEYQIEDAWTHAQAVRAREALPLVWRWREWAVAAFLAGVLALLLILPNPQAEAVAQRSAERVALAEAADALKDVTEAVALDRALTPEEREQILEALENSINTLQEPGVTPEEAFAALADTEAALQNQAEQLKQQQEAQAAAMQAAADALRRLQEGGAGGEQSPIPTLEQLRQNLNQMSVEQLQQAAQALEEAARSLQPSNPQAAQAMQQAAQSMREGSTGAAGDALEEASQGLQQQLQTREATAEELSRAAQAVRQAGAQISEQGQELAEGGQQPEQGQPQPGEGGEQVQSGQPQPGQEGDEGQGGQESQQAGDGEQGRQPGEGEGREGEPQGDSPPNASDSPALGAGDAPGGAGSDEMGGEPQQPGAGEIEQNNNPDGGGLGEFEPVFAPRRIGGQGGEQIVLEPDAGDVPAIEGEFSQNPTGSASVPYNQVFSDYRDAANRALERDYIPLSLRDVVRDYFSSLEPSR